MKMKTIGMIGGMSWESTAIYYKLLNRKTKEALGDTHSCPLILHSLDFAVISELQHQRRWEDLATMMVDAATKLEKAGAECIILCTNTMHRLADKIEANIGVQFLHISDALGDAIVNKNMKKVALLGTKFTMEQGFVKDRLLHGRGIQTIIPDERQRDVIHNIIYNELVLGEINYRSKLACLEIIDGLVKSGVEGVILGCTELGLLLTQNDTKVLLFDTTEIHVCKAVKFALN